MFSMCVTDREFSVQYEEIRKLTMKNIVLKTLLNDTEKSIDHVSLSLDRSESLMRRTTNHLYDLHEYPYYRYQRNYFGIL